MKWKKYLKEIQSQSKILLLILFIMAGVRTAFADWSYVPSGSMEPTLYHGDYVWISKTKYGPTIPFVNIQLMTYNQPERGDIITFVPPHTKKLYVKRVIGTPGDTIEIDKNNITVNGTKLSSTVTSNEDGLILGDESILNKKHLFQISEDGNLPVVAGKIQVPPGKYFVMGDHRNNSADSRYWGFVDEKKIMGKVTHVALSFSKKRPLFSRFFIPTP